MVRRNRILGLAMFLAGLAAAMLWLREPLEPLTRENLASARQRWRDSGIQVYRMAYRMNRDRYEVEAEDGIVIATTVNGLRPRSESFREYSVEGLFSLLAMELDNLHDPAGPFAGRAVSVLARVRFNPQHGYVERYVRSAGGMGRGADIELIEFADHTAGKADKSKN